MISLALIALDRITVPAEISGGMIYVKVKVNGKDAEFVLDTGAGINVVTPSAAKRLGIKGGAETEVQGVAAKTTTQVTTLESLAVGDYVANQQPAIIVELPKLLACDGLIGFHFLSQGVVTLDYAGSTVTFDRSGGFKAPADAKSAPMTLHNNVPTIEISAAGKSGRAQMDSGASNSLTFFPKFIEETRLKDRLTKSRLDRAVGVGGGMATVTGWFDGYTVAGFKTPGSYVQLASRGKGVFNDATLAGNLGYEEMRRFTISIDYKHSTTYLAPNALFGEPPLVNRGGAQIDFDGARHFVIGIQKGSAADVAGMLTGDVIETIDGEDVSKRRPMWLSTVFRRPAGTKVEVRVSRKDGSHPTLTLILADPK